MLGLGRHIGFRSSEKQPHADDSSLSDVRCFFTEAGFGRLSDSGFRFADASSLSDMRCFFTSLLKPSFS